ncbi:unnamed protein product [Symbiodinium necroappetens]|uniref:Ion transport domain-containing protein n=1 Tax=Symbiodinium necroappetens TaxID=1628268 RepID=A0A812ZI64_9DINO|nr:unnamed protein product [Symbiodinium necroappetens]
MCFFRGHCSVPTAVHYLSVIACNLALLECRRLARFCLSCCFKQTLHLRILTLEDRAPRCCPRGLDDTVTAQLTKLNRTSSEISGSVDVDSSDWTDQYHRAVRYQFLILSMVITVVVMNVYIGLLGELYQQAEKRSRQLYNHYRATCAYRHMCERLALCFLPNKLGICCGESSGKTDSGLYWFIYNKKLLTDDEDGDSDSKSD